MLSINAWRHIPQRILELLAFYTMQGPTPGALQEMLDNIDKQTEQVYNNPPAVVLQAATATCAVVCRVLHVVCTNAAL